MKLRFLIATAAATLVLAAPAQADDASLYSAYTDTLRAERDAANDAYTAAIKDAKRNGATRAEVERIIAANQQINSVAKQIHDAVVAQEPSTDHGSEAKTHALRQYDLIIRANNFEMKGDEAWLDGKDKRARRYYRRSDATYRSHLRACIKAGKAFKKAGFAPPKDEK